MTSPNVYGSLCELQNDVKCEKMFFTFWAGLGIVKKGGGPLFLEDRSREEPPQDGGVGGAPEVCVEGSGSLEVRLEKQ